MSIKTDSTPVAEPKDPDQCGVFALFKLFAQADERDAVEGRYREGGIGYGEVKKRLVELVLDHFNGARERRRDLGSNPEIVRKALDGGAERARESARKTLKAAREAAGV